MGNGLVAERGGVPMHRKPGTKPRVRISKRWLVPFLLAFVVFAVLGVVSRKYIWLYISRKPDPRPLVTASPWFQPSNLSTLNRSNAIQKALLRVLRL